MALYKDVHYDQDKFIPVSFQKQILPGTSARRSVTGSGYGQQWPGEHTTANAAIQLRHPGNYGYLIYQSPGIQFAHLDLTRKALEAFLNDRVIRELIAG